MPGQLRQPSIPPPDLLRPQTTPYRRISVHQFSPSRPLPVRYRGEYLPQARQVFGRAGRQVVTTGGTASDPTGQGHLLEHAAHSQTFTSYRSYSVPFEDNSDFLNII